MGEDMQARNMIRNGVSEEGMRELFRRGYAAEVVCAEEPRPNSARNNYLGVWHIRAVSPTGDIERVLVTQRNEEEPRQIRSVFGVVTLLLQLGCDGVNIPFREGGRRTNCLPRSNKPVE